MNPSARLTSHGFSLVVSLIILTLLSVLVVSFLTSTQLDRTTARAFFGKSQAELAADTGVNQAIGLLRDHITEYPDSVTFWEMLRAPEGGEGRLPVEGTMLYFNEQAPADGYTGAGPTGAVRRRILPLMSRGVNANGQLLGSVPVEEKANALGVTGWREMSRVENGRTLEETCVDLNRPRFNGDVAGWIGSPLPAPNQPALSPRPYRARWIELKENGNPQGKTVGRFAFWIEDESFRLNLNSLGSPTTGRGSEWNELRTVKTTPVVATAPAALQPTLLASLNPMQGVIRAVRAPAATNRDATAAALTALRASFLGERAPDQRTFNQVELNAISPTTGKPLRLADEAKFLTTTHSAALNLSRHGSQRLNLNGIGFDKRWDQASVRDAELQKGIDQVVSTIRYHAPRFSQRFYRTLNSSNAAVLNDENTVQPRYRDIYLYKIAANIRDYIDPDSQPTMINDRGKIDWRGRQPRLALPDTDGPALSELWVQGKDSAPFLQEAVARYRSSISGSRWELRVDYYIEFWNMTDRDITAEDLGPNPVLIVNNQIGWVTVGAGGRSLRATASAPGSLGDPSDTDLLRATVVSLRNGVAVGGQVANRGVVFKAGQATVITTDPDFSVRTTGASSPDFSGSFNAANVYLCQSHLSAGTGGWPRSNRFYQGTLPNGATGIKPFFRNGGEDYVTEVILANDMGYLEFHVAPIAHGGGGQSTTGTRARDDWYGGTLFGNSSGSATPSQLADPRTNNEQLIFTRFMSGASTGEPDQSRYWNTVGSPRFTLGFPNTAGGGTLYANPHMAPPAANWPTGAYPTAFPFPWPDYYRGWDQSVANAAQNPDWRTAPARGFDGKLVDATTGAVLNPPTPLPLLSVGQLGDVFDPARLRGSRGSLGIEGSRGGGRTLRIGQRDDRIDPTSPTAPSRAWAAWRLADFLSVSSELEVPGLININGLLRDCVRDEMGNLVLDESSRALGAGAALRAAAYGMKLFSVSRPNNSNTTTASVVERDLNSEEPAAAGNPAAALQNVIQQAIRRMTDNDPGAAGYHAARPYFGPFAERGEISELEGFSLGTGLLTGVKMEEAFDRSREETVRRLMELITTRGSIFTVYVVGQAIAEGPAPRRQQTVTGTHQVKVTFQLVPKRRDGSDFRVREETFDPLNRDEVINRFAKPHHYDVRILQIGS